MKQLRNKTNVGREFAGYEFPPKPDNEWVTVPNEVHDLLMKKKKSLFDSGEKKPKKAVKKKKEGEK